MMCLQLGKLSCLKRSDNSQLKCYILQCFYCMSSLQDKLTKFSTECGFYAINYWTLVFLLLQRYHMCMADHKDNWLLYWERACIIMVNTQVLHKKTNGIVIHMYPQAHGTAHMAKATTLLIWLGMQLSI